MLAYCGRARRGGALRQTIPRQDKMGVYTRKLYGLQRSHAILSDNFETANRSRWFARKHSIPYLLRISYFKSHYSTDRYLITSNWCLLQHFPVLRTRSFLKPTKILNHVQDIFQYRISEDIFVNGCCRLSSSNNVFNLTTVRLENQRILPSIQVCPG